ncbi:MAG: PspC domain-containing protein [Erysipelotrichaceae bacterium]|nr:PspC domain-containing protein [Erysipelotrichaceae bacterium]MBR3693907.1 PspC domain-containing protein [Erysipelotrichales bacterium]
MKKLYKDKSNGKISGVCAGLAEYSNMDVKVVRFLWLMLALVNVMGPILYLICHFVLPEKSEENLF